jgi:DNA-binding NarL/FixJ family response regulator
LLYFVALRIAVKCEAHARIPAHGIRWVMTSRVVSISERHRTRARLLIADDHEIVRMGLRLVLANQGSFEICGEAADGTDAIAKVRELAPDLVLLDLSMPTLNGFDTALEIRRISPSTKIVLFSVHEIPATAKIIGADAFIPKGCSTEQLVRTLQHVLQMQGH